MDGAISQIIERDGRRFVFLKGWNEASVSQIATIFEPAIDMMLADRPPPAGDYYFAGCADETSLLQTPAHDVPSGATCECGATADKMQQEWLHFWSILGIPPRDNLIRYNLEGITNRVAEIRGGGWSESDAQFIITASIAHELYHVKNHQGMLCVEDGEAHAYDCQCDFMTRAARLFGVPPVFLEAWLRQTRDTQRKHEMRLRETHPSWGRDP